MLIENGYMKKLAITVAAAFLILALCSCSGEAREDGPLEGRFEIETSIRATVITDTETGVQYLYFQRGHSGGLTVLVDADGKPLLKKEQ